MQFDSKSFSHFLERMNVKSDVIDAIQQMPESVGIGEILSEVEFLAGLREAEKQSAAKLTVSHEEVVAALGVWAGK